MTGKKPDLHGNERPHMDIVNQKEIVVFGIKRSGNHAIIRWLLKHLGQTAVHLNDVTGASPYDSCTEINVKGLPAWRCQPTFRNLRRWPWRRPEMIEYSKKDPKVNWHYLRQFAPKDGLILSYENCFLDNPAYAEFLQDHDRHVGASAERYRIVILRDAFNWFASLCRMTMVSPAERATCIEIYKQYAELFLDPEKQRAQRIICANYNEWFQKRDYRISLARKFGIHSDGNALLDIPTIGGGSSFDGTRFAGHAQNMNVLERWKLAHNDPAYRTILNDPRLMELSNAIFGPIMPTTSS
jgi:hypothetical protein